MYRTIGADLFAKAFKTIKSFDNGGVYSDVKVGTVRGAKAALRTAAYYCHPYSSYERGSNECQNKMIRRKFPKGTDFGKGPLAEIGGGGSMDEQLSA